MSRGTLLAAGVLVALLVAVVGFVALSRVEVTGVVSHRVDGVRYEIAVVEERGQGIWPLPGVFREQAPRGWRFVEVDGAGRFAFAFEGFGREAMIVPAVAGADVDETLRGGIGRLETGSRSIELDVALPPHAVVEVRCRLDAATRQGVERALAESRAGARDEDDPGQFAGLIGATLVQVTAHRVSADADVVSTAARPDGAAVLVLAPGTWVLQARIGESPAGSRSRAHVVTLGELEHVQLELDLVPAVSWEGRLVGAAGEAITPRAVVLSAPPPAAGVFTGASAFAADGGRVELVDAVPGLYSIRIEQAGGPVVEGVVHFDPSLDAIVVHPL